MRENPLEGFPDEIILVDDASTDDTVQIARKLGLTVITHDRNKGYGPKFLFRKFPIIKSRRFKRSGGFYLVNLFIIECPSKSREQ